MSDTLWHKYRVIDVFCSVKHVVQSYCNISVLICQKYLHQITVCLKRFSHKLSGSVKSVYKYLYSWNLQLSISMWQSCLSMGKYWRFIGQDAVMVNLKATDHHQISALNIKHCFCTMKHTSSVLLYWWKIYRNMRLASCNVRGEKWRNFLF